MSFKLTTNHITIETTNLCDGNCVMCPRDKYEPKPETMTMGLWKRIIDDLATHSYRDKLVIDTQGLGDPFLDRALFKRLKYARDKISCTRFFTSTNAFRMTPHYYKDIMEYITELRFSHYAITKETYNKVHRGTLDFHVTRDNIKGFLEYRKKKGGGSPWCIGQMVLIDEINDHEYQGWLDYWEPLCDEVIVWRPHDYGGLRKYRYSNGVDHSKQVSCGRPINGGPYVHCDGIVSICCWDINENLVIGDLKTQTIEEIMHDEPFQIIKKKHLKKDFKGLYCWHCEQTIPDPTAIVYTNKGRELCTMTSDHLKFIKESK